MQRLMRILGDLSTTRGKLKLLILVTGFLIIVGAVSAGAINATSTPQFCSTCHEMQPEYVTWQVSSHANTATCIQCHIEPGIAALVKDKAKAMVQVWEHVTGTYPDPIVMPHDLPNDNCERCHEVGEIAPKGELKIPHEKHLAGEVSCVTCHRGVAHADIARRGLTTGTDFSQWTIEKAKEEFTRENTLPSMEACMTCHTERKVSNDCTTCHSDLASLGGKAGAGTPSNHQAAGWKSSHGKTAREDLSTCNTCHAGSPPVSGQVKSVSEFTRGNQFCSSCHNNRPEDHTPDWMLVHKQGVAAKGLDNCQVCHSVGKPEEGSGATATYCNKCHQFKEN